MLFVKWFGVCANQTFFLFLLYHRPPEPVYSTVNKLCDKPASPRHYSPVECDKSFLLSSPYPHYHLGLLPDSEMTRYCMRFLTSSSQIACAFQEWNEFWNEKNLPLLTSFASELLLKVERCSDLFVQWEKSRTSAFCFKCNHRTLTWSYAIPSVLGSHTFKQYFPKYT